MTDQNGGQTPAGWYPDGSGQVRYWDGAAWTEHVQPQQPEAPAAPAAPAEPAAASQPAGAIDPTQAAAGAGVAGAAGGAAATDAAWQADADAAGPQPFYKKPAGLAVIAVVLLLVIAGAAFALTSGGDDDEGTVGTPTSAASTPVSTPAATTATQTFTLHCEPVSKIEGSNNEYPFNLTLTATPTEISVSADTSIKNTGPTTIEIDKYRFEAIVSVNGAPLTLIGPSNKAEAPGETGGKQPIFKAAELPLIAKATPPAGFTAGTPVILQDVYFNNFNNDPTGTEKLTDTFDSRCNTSPQPNAAPQPIGLSVPPAAGGTTGTAPSSVAPSVATP